MKSEICKFYIGINLFHHNYKPHILIKNCYYKNKALKCIDKIYSIK